MESEQLILIVIAIIIVLIVIFVLNRNNSCDELQSSNLVAGFAGSCSSDRPPEPQLNYRTFQTTGNVSSFDPQLPTIPASVTCLTFGNPANPIALYVHGILVGGSDEARFLGRRLAREGYYFVAPDLRGFGQSLMNGVQPPGDSQNGTNGVPFYIVRDLMEISAAIGVSNHIGKNLFIGCCSGIILGYYLDNSMKPHFGNNAPFNKMVGLGNFGPVPMVRDYLFDSPNLSQQQASWLAYIYQISQENGFKNDLWKNLFNVPTFKELLLQNPNANIRDVNMQVASTLAGDENDLMWQLGFPDAFFDFYYPDPNVVDPEIEYLYIYTKGDPFFKPLDRWSQNEIKNVVKSYHPGSTVRFYFPPNCVQHWATLDDLVKTNNRIANFAKLD